MNTTKQKAVVLLSGGLDSSTALYFAKKQHDCYALSFDYNQRHKGELQAAKRVAAKAGVKEHVIINFDMRLIGGSALTDDIAVPKDRAIDASIPPTYVQARNTIFLSFALAYAERIGAQHIFIGVNALDYSGYPDCRPEYLAAFAQMAQLATVAGTERNERISFHAPLIHLTKAEIIREGTSTGVPYELTHSCYDPVEVPKSNSQVEYLACGTCDSCQLRLKGFAEAGLVDPVQYVQKETAA